MNRLQMKRLLKCVVMLCAVHGIMLLLTVLLQNPLKRWTGMSRENIMWVMDWGALRGLYMDLLMAFLAWGMWHYRKDKMTGKTGNCLGGMIGVWILVQAVLSLYAVYHGRSAVYTGSTDQLMNESAVNMLVFYTGGLFLLAKYLLFIGGGYSLGSSGGQWAGSVRIMKAAAVILCGASGAIYVLVSLWSVAVMPDTRQFFLGSYSMYSTANIGISFLSLAYTAVMAVQMRAGRKGNGWKLPGLLLLCAGLVVVRGYGDVIVDVINENTLHSYITLPRYSIRTSLINMAARMEDAGVLLMWLVLGISLGWERMKSVEMSRKTVAEESL